MRSLFVVVCVLLSSCIVAPKNYSMRYAKEDTGLAQRINIDGYYVSEHGCDSTFYSLYMFYPDGIFTIATTSEVSKELVECFVDGGKTRICQYPLWGTYELEGDTIKTQAIRADGGGCVIFRDYLITKDKQLVNLSDYVDARYTLIAAMENYPSFKANECKKKAKFYPIAKKRSREDCSYINRKWF